MSVNESSATALVRFTGLGIVCFNKEKQRGEIAIIRDNKHTLSIKIQKPVFQEGTDSDVIVYQDIATYENLPKDGVQIEIKAAGAAATVVTIEKLRKRNPVVAGVTLLSMPLLFMKSVRLRYSF